MTQEDPENENGNLEIGSLLKWSCRSGERDLGGLSQKWWPRQNDNDLDSASAIEPTRAAETKINSFKIIHDSMTKLKIWRGRGRPRKGPKSPISLILSWIVNEVKFEKERTKNVLGELLTIQKVKIVEMKTKRSHAWMKKHRILNHKWHKLVNWWG